MLWRSCIILIERCLSRYGSKDHKIESGNSYEPSKKFKFILYKPESPKPSGVIKKLELSASKTALCILISFDIYIVNVLCG